MGKDPIGQQGAVAPQALAVGAPQQGDLPARQRLARVPLSLPVVEETAGREAIEQTRGQCFAPRPLVGAVGSRRPFLCFHVVGSHEGGLPSEGEAHVPGRQRLVDLFAQRVDRAPTAPLSKAG